MVTLDDIYAQRSVVLNRELVAHNMRELAAQRPYDDAVKRRLKEAREELRSQKRLLEQMEREFTYEHQRRMF